MSLNQALALIERLRADGAFRKECCLSGTPERFARLLSGAGYELRRGEAGDAFRSLLLKAPDEEAADEIKELRQLYTILSGGDEDACSACGIACPGKNACASSGACPAPDRIPDLPTEGATS